MFKMMIMKRYIILSLIIILVFLSSFAQQERKLIREGNKNYKEKNYPKSLNNFLYADSILGNAKDKISEENEGLRLKLNNNIGASKYRNNNFEPAVENYQQLIEKSNSNKEKADAYYNIGNSYLQAKEYQKSISAYKNALRNDPNHNNSRYNMAVATKAQQKQQQQQKQEKDNQQKQEKNQEQQENKEQNENQKQEKNQDKQEQQGKQEKEMDKQEMERFLEALQEKDKEIQEKAKKEQEKTNKRKTEKEW